MKNLQRMMLLGVVVLGAVAQTSLATPFSFAYTFGDGTTVTGSFDGNQNGNVVSGISGVSMSIDGLAVTGPLFVASYFAPSAQVSYAGAANDFEFVDGDPYDPFSTITAGFAIADIGLPVAAVENDAGSVPYNLELFDPTQWHLTGGTGAVPDGGSTVVLFGSALAGLALTRHKFAGSR